MWDRGRPAITASLRGLVGEAVTIRCADRDLHSGLFGGPAWNPIRVLTKILASLHDDTGRVTLPGFYDGVPEVPADVRASWETLGTTTESFLSPVGLKTLAGEAGLSELEQVWARPTCEFNGVVGGYTGDGFKTVLPAEASAKVSFRLVGAQDPTKIRAAFRDRVRSMLPPEAEVEFHPHGGSPGFAMPYDSPWLKAGLSDRPVHPHGVHHRGCGLRGLPLRCRMHQHRRLAPPLQGPGHRKGRHRGV
jgi:acetylornithine deacetylase/succinyl-diaminopimelate desuccinylase-like protein